jgi:predicted glycosyltransferase
MKRQGKRIVVYFNSLHGVGHYVRACSIAEAVASFAEVIIINGGRHINNLPLPPRAKMISLPEILRDPDSRAIRSRDTRYSLCEIFESRRLTLNRLIEDQSIQGLIIEYFPFQRWEFAEEIFYLINAFKRTNARARIISSVRDFPKPPSSAYEQHRIAKTLINHFDAVLVHGDMRICGHSGVFARWNDNMPPVTYTGYIDAETVVSDTNTMSPQGIEALYGNVVVSCGGGVDSLEILLTCIKAWQQLVQTDQTHGKQMVVFLGAFLKEEDKREVVAATMESRWTKVFEFSPWFSQVLANAALSISCAGYNTCVEIIRSNVKAIFIPSTLVSDQIERANRLASLGIGRVLSTINLTVPNVMSAIVDSLNMKTRQATLSLDGLNSTKKIVRALIAH